MGSKYMARSSKLFALEITKIIIILSIVIWGARLWHAPDFGLYEDDYTRVPDAAEMTGPQLWQFVSNTNWWSQGQGRPLHPIFIYLLSWLGWKFAELNSIYWIGYTILVVNAFLFYLLLRRRSNQVVATTGALVFALFPADTTQIFLTHSLGIQPSLMFFLLASHLYLSGYRFWAYLVALGSLLTYETIYLVFLAVPLLTGEWNSRLRREMVKHGLVLGILLVILVIIRSFVGESRIAELRLPEAVLFPVFQLIVGPIVSMALFLYRPIQVLLAMEKEIIVGMALISPVIAWGLSQVTLDIEVFECKSFATTGNNNFPLREMLNVEHMRRHLGPKNVRQLYKLALTGLIMLVLAYPLMLTVPGFRINGRATRVHFASIVGSSLIGACISSAFLNWANAVGKRRTAVLALTGYLTVLAGFGFVVQKDYRTSWEYQRQFWTDVIKLVPDAGKGTVILVEPGGLPDTEQIGANTWNLPRIINQVYELPPDWVDDPPRVFRLKQNWQKNIVTDERAFQISDKTVAGSPSLFRTVYPFQVILLEFDDGQYTRKAKPLIIDGYNFFLKDKSDPNLSSLDKGILYDYLIEGAPAE